MGKNRRPEPRTRDRGARAEKTHHSEDTLFKVYAGLAAVGIQGQQATDAVFQMQNQGILFRERTPETQVELPKAPFFALRIPTGALAGAVLAEKSRQIGKGYTLEHDAEHGVGHLIVIAADRLLAKKPVEGFAVLSAALDVINKENGH